MSKKILHTLFVILLISLLTVVGATAVSAAVSKEGLLPFEDVKGGAWYRDAVEFCYVNHVAEGMNEYTFAPSKNLTRAQLVTMLAKIEDADVSECTTEQFTDVKPSHWYFGAVSWAYQSGIVSGTSETAFSPNAPITREALSRITALYMQGKGIEIEVTEDCLERFTDRYDISDWALDSMKYAVSAELISGMSENTVSPKGNVTRAQAARIFMLYLESYGSESHEHNYTEATCTDPSVCTVCGIKKGLPLGHDVSDSFSCKFDFKSECKSCGYWVESSSMPHTYAAATCGRPETCIRCSVQRGAPVGEHTWWQASCTVPKMCKVCYKTEGAALGHSWKRADCVNPKTCTRCKATEGSALSENGTHTWWYATCKNPKMCKICYITEGEPLPHVWNEGNCKTSKSCTLCGTDEGVYGDHQWWSATCKNPKMCKICYITEGEPLPHVWSDGSCKTPKSCTLCGKESEVYGDHQWWAATCVNPKMCKLCYKAEGEALGHSWKRADCVNPMTCTRCKQTEGSALTENGTHTWWSATCKNPKMCKVCYVTEGEAAAHQWWQATCLNPKMCKNCYTTEGSALGHDWKAATCTDPKTCKRCSVTEGSSLGRTHEWWSATCVNPRMCKLCYTTEGEALGHDWKAATCTQPKTCKKCNTTEGKALGHTTNAGTCTRCNKLYLATAFDKVVYYVTEKTATEAGKLLYETISSNEKHYISLDSYSSDTVTLSYEYSYNGKVFSHLTVEFRRNGDCYFVYMRTDGSVFGTGRLDPLTYTKAGRECFDVYVGADSVGDTDKLNVALDRAFDMCNKVLKSAYGGSVADLGFSKY